MTPEKRRQKIKKRQKLSRPNKARQLKSSKGNRLNMCTASGGNWNNSSNAGVWARNCNNSRTNSNNNYSFRADSAPP